MIEIPLNELEVTVAREYLRLPEVQLGIWDTAIHEWFPAEPGGDPRCYHWVYRSETAWCEIPHPLTDANARDALVAKLNRRGWDVEVNSYPTKPGSEHPVEVECYAMRGEDAEQVGFVYWAPAAGEAVCNVCLQVVRSEKKTYENKP
jgi:hypothetical protein